MLPDLRIVIAAVISTFVLTVGVGFFASSRLIQEPKKRTDSLAALDETPVNRIALSWPAPTRHPDQPALDFAVTAKALRNPVRDVTNETPKPVKESAAKPQTPEPITDAARPARQLDASVETEALAPVAAPAEVLSEAPPPAASLAPPAPEPDIRVAVQYPPIMELPPELQAPVVAPIAAAPAVAEPDEPQPETPAATGSIAATPPASDDETPARTKPVEPQTASRPDAEADVARNVQLPELPKPAPNKAARKKAVPKKAAPVRAKRPARAVRRTARPANPATTAFPFFWGGAVR